MAEIRGKNVLITGASRGIGLGIAKTLGLRGANVCINCRASRKELEDAAFTLKELGINAMSIMGDVSVYSECCGIFKAVCDNFGSVDILVNNAGISLYGLFTGNTPEDWKRITEVNQYSVYNCCHVVLPDMIRRKSGRIINISSIWGVSGASCEVVYSASKGAVNAFSMALAKEVAPSGIFVNAIACGIISTRMNEGFTHSEMEELRQSIGLMRLGTPEDAAALCVYLAETEYMTGQVLRLDGGF